MSARPRICTVSVNVRPCWSRQPGGLCGARENACQFAVYADDLMYENKEQSERIEYLEERSDRVRELQIENNELRYQNNELTKQIQELTKQIENLKKSGKSVEPEPAMPVEQKESSEQQKEQTTAEQKEKEFYKWFKSQTLVEKRRFTFAIFRTSGFILKNPDKPAWKDFCFSGNFRTNNPQIAKVIAKIKAEKSKPVMPVEQKESIEQKLVMPVEQKVAEHKPAQKPSEPRKSGGRKVAVCKSNGDGCRNRFYDNGLCKYYHPCYAKKFMSATDAVDIIKRIKAGEKIK